MICPPISLRFWNSPGVRLRFARCIHAILYHIPNVNANFFVDKDYLRLSLKGTKIIAQGGTLGKVGFVIPSLQGTYNCHVMLLPTGSRNLVGIYLGLHPRLYMCVPFFQGQESQYRRLAPLRIQAPFTIKEYPNGDHNLHGHSTRLAIEHLAGHC